MVKKLPNVDEMSGKEFRVSLRKPSPVLPEGRRAFKIRTVPAFTIQSMQQNVKVQPPMKFPIYEPIPIKDSLFKVAFLNGQFPISIENVGKHVCWKVPVDKLDYHYYMPLFFDGLVELGFPCKFYANEGIKDLIRHGSNKVLPVVPQLILPIKNALNTKNEEVILCVLKALQNLVINCDRVGEALVPYYRQILPTLNLFKEKNANVGESVERKESIGSVIEETLQILERYGGDDAFINIKYMVPTYESCVQN